MKKGLWLVIVLLMRLMVQGQDIVIKAPDKPAYCYKSYHVDTLGIKPGPKGQGQLWDFRSYSLTDPGVLNFFEEVGDIPYKQCFPTANYVITSDDKSNLTFLHRGDDVIGEVGNIYFTDGVIFEGVDSPEPDTLDDYPLYYGKHTYHKNKFTQYYRADTTKAKLSLSVSSTIDGSGTLITPDGREYQALRRVEKVFQIAEVYKMVDGGYEFYFHEEDYMEKYKWISPELPFPFVFNITSNRRMRKFPDHPRMEYTDDYAFYYKPVRATESPNFNATNLHVTRDMVNTIYVAYAIEYPGNGVIQIIDMSGKTVLREDVNSPEHTPTENVKELNTASLVPGIYIICYTSEQERGVTKWVKK